MRFAGRFMQAAVDAGTAIGRSRRTAIDPSTIRRIASARPTATAAGSIAPRMAKPSGAIEAVLPNADEFYYGIHGSRTSGLTELVPKAGNNAVKTGGAVEKTYGAAANPGAAVFTYPTEGLPDQHISEAIGYSLRSGEGTGSLYIVRAPKSRMQVPKWNASERYSKEAMEVVGEFPPVPLPEANPATGFPDETAVERETKIIQQFRTFMQETLDRERQRTAPKVGRSISMAARGSDLLSIVESGEISSRKATTSGYLGNKKFLEEAGVTEVGGFSGYNSTRARLESGPLQGNSNYGFVRASDDVITAEQYRSFRVNMSEHGELYSSTSRCKKCYV